jgi:hypothetical protein
LCIPVYVVNIIESLDFHTMHSSMWKKSYLWCFVAARFASGGTSLWLDDTRRDVTATSRKNV